jgi:hypothetical protein
MEKRLSVMDKRKEFDPPTSTINVIKALPLEQVLVLNLTPS